MLRTKLKCLWLFLCLFLVTSHAENVTRNSVDPVRQQKTFDDDDTVVIEAAPLERKRIGRQIDFYQGSWAQALGEGSACLSSIGLLGSCMSFHNCYPYYKFPFLGLYDPFLGSYDQCTYVSGTGQQEFGVCCTNQLGGVPTLPVEQPQIPEIPQVPAQLPTPEPVVDIGQPKPPSGVNVTDEQDSKLEPWPPQSPTHPPTVSTTTLQWPPPIPTHPPDHQAPTHPAFPSWPPQSPTHPPFAGHPGFPSYPTHPSFPTHPAAFPGHPSFPTHPPSIPPSHPSFPPSQSPIYPSFPGWPPTTPQRPPSTTRPPVSWPPTTKPPSWPPTTKPPSWPPTTKPPPSWPPTTKPPASWPPTTKPPPSWPPTTKPPPSRPPTTKPPVSRPPDSGFQAQCGAKNGVLDQERIVGGQSASPNEWPWIVVLFNNGRQFCGGSLLDNIHILTAAHCVAHMSSWDVARLKAHLGDHNIKSATEVQHVERAIKRVVRHRGFDSRTLYNDVAILTMDRPVEFTQNIRPICLPTGQSDYTGKVATVIGWGSLRENGQQPSILQKVSIPIWRNQDCSLKYGAAAPGGIIETMLCAGQNAKDSCSGDSGGPLMVNEGRWVQVGIVSWGIGCGKGQYPGVYSRVTHFLPWIRKNLEGNN